MDSCMFRWDLPMKLLLEKEGGEEAVKHHIFKLSVIQFDSVRYLEVPYNHERLIFELTVHCLTCYT